MLRSLWTAATGMNSMQTGIDNLSNNLANVNTAGFKRGMVEFQDLLYQDVVSAGSITAAGINHPTGIQIGLGSKPVSIEKIHTTGNPKPTENPYDMMIQGSGFFQVQMPDGSTGYTRDGSFKVDGNGNVVSADGYLLIPNITVPQNASEFSVGEDGIVSVRLPGNAQETQLGQIQLARFVNPAGLQATGKNLFKETTASGAPQVNNPMADGFGSILHKYLEMSNVNVVNEMVDMITQQRAYEMNSKTIQTSDAMLQTVGTLKR